MSMRFVASYPCHTSSLADMRRDLRRWLEGAGLPRRTTDAAVLTAHEAATNAVVHSVPCTGYTVSAELDEVLEIVVGDGGNWDDRRQHDPGRGGAGRGFEIMQGLASSLELERRPDGTTVRITFARPTFEER